MTTQTTNTTDAGRALKAKHRAMWAFGDYPAVATDLVSSLGPILVDACQSRPGDRVLDVAAGTGNAAIPAAEAGARVVASDLTPELLETGQREAGRRGTTLEWRQADAEDLPFADGEFDTVMSCLGVMFAPFHQASADELIRVCRPGGTIGLVNWTPEGFIGQMFATMKPYAPPPPPGAQPPPLWGREDHVRALLGDQITDVKARRQTVRVDLFGRPEDFRDYFKANYGPTIAVYRALADDPGRTAALDAELADLARRHDLGAGDADRTGTTGNTVMEWEYLLLTARKRA
jgi:SAM-dependent methyltransferase